MWDTIIYNYLKKRNIVIPPKNRSEKSDKFGHTSRNLNQVFMNMWCPLT